MCVPSCYLEMALHVTILKDNTSVKPAENLTVSLIICYVHFCTVNFNFVPICLPTPTCYSMMHRDRLLMLSWTTNTQITNRKPSLLCSILNFAYQCKNIMNSHRIDTKHWNERLFPRSWLTTYLTITKCVFVRQTFAVVTWNCLMTVITAISRGSPWGSKTSRLPHF
jgi:hypothetical protein